MDLNELLKQAQRLTIEEPTGVEYPRVERTIGEVLQATEELHARVTQTGTKVVQAQKLLDSKGIDLPEITEKLESLSARQIFEPLEPMDDTDIESFLKNERENIIMSSIDEVKSHLHDSTHKQKWSSVMYKWNQEKIRLLNELADPSHDFLNIERMTEPTVLNETCSKPTRLNRIEMRYADAVFKYNDAIIKRGYRPNLAQMLSRAVHDCVSDQVKDMWSILMYMVDVTPISTSMDPIKARQQTPQFVSQAKLYLESRYKIYMSSIVNFNVNLSERSCVLSIYNLVSSYVSVKFNPSNSIGLVDFVNDKPLWPLVYYSIRCGELKTALTFLKNADYMHEELMEVLQAKINSPDLKINYKLDGHLKLQYFNKIKNSTDPFQKATYCIILGCDAQDPHSEVAKSIEDFLWIQLSVLRVNEDCDYSTEQLTYAGLQSLILEKYGENYFKANEQAHVYFEVLALTGQFEAGIEFLARTEANRPHAVHMALALNESGMLGGPRSVQESLLSVDLEDPQPLRRLNLARLTMLYVKPFKFTDTAEALQYYFFLRAFKDPEGQDLFRTCVCDLVLETAAYELVLGKLDPSGNGDIIGGLFEQFHSANYDTKGVAKIVAENLLQRGMLEKAIKLFDLSGMHNQALKNLSALLSQVVHRYSKPESMRENMAIEAETFHERLIAHKINVEPQIATTFSLLRELLFFFDYYHDGKHELALEVLARTKLAPMNMNEVDECLQKFKRLDDEVCRVFPDVMLAAMDIVYQQYKEIQNNFTHPSDTYKDDKLKLLREKAIALNNLVAIVPYRMPGDTNKKLMQIELLLH